MKKSKLFLLVLACSFTILFVSCEKQNINNELKDQKLLSEDKIFIELVTETQEYLNYLAAIIKANSINKDILNNQLAELRAKNLSFENQMKKIDVMFNGQISIRLSAHMRFYNKSMEVLHDRYGIFDPINLTLEVEQVISNMVNIQETIKVKSLSAIDCGWRYYGCTAAATAGAILCHAGCDTTALAVSAGLGIPACVLACGTLQAWAIIECSERFCNIK